MGSIGACCCGGCNGNCCIERIDVDFAVPEPGQPGASWGSFGWDVGTPPTSEEITQTIAGVPRLVCKTIYVAPNTTACAGANLLTYNAEFKTLERTVQYDFWNWTPLFPPITGVWGVGQLRFVVYKYVRNLTLTYYKYLDLARIVLTGSVDEILEFGPDTGYRYREYDSSCNLTYDATKTTPFARKRCSRGGACRPNITYDVKNDNNLTLYRTFEMPIQRDSGWVSASCASFPTNDTTEALIFGDSYSSSSSGTFPSNLCRVPSGSTLVVDPDPPSCTAGGTSTFRHQLTYTPDAAWTARHPVTITPCSDGPSEEEEIP